MLSLHPRRLLVPMGAAVLCGGLGFAATAVIGSSGSDGGHEPSAAAHGELQPQGFAGIAGSDSFESMQDDPGAGEQLRWGVIVFKAKNGQTCAAPARTDGDSTGVVARDGSIRRYPIEDGATCVDLNALPAGVQVTQGTQADSRTVVYGIAGPEVAVIHLRLPAESRQLRIGPRGSFLAVLPVTIAFDEIEVSAKLNDGGVKHLLG